LILLKLYDTMQGKPRVKKQGFSCLPSKTLHFSRSKNPMYKSQDRKTLFLFPEVFPFGGTLNENNRWLRVAELIPWEELEDEYRKHFSHVGRPAKDGHLVIGLLLLKHMTGLSDEGVAGGEEEPDILTEGQTRTSSVFEESDEDQKSDSPGEESNRAER